MRDDRLAPLDPSRTKTFAHQWEHCRGFLLPALARAGETHTELDLIELIMAGRAQFWPEHDCAALTELLVTPRLKSCHWFLVGGQLDPLLTVLAPRVETWARAMGCRRMTGVGRDGWERTLPDYRKTAIVIEKEL